MVVTVLAVVVFVVVLTMVVLAMVVLVVAVLVAVVVLMFTRRRCLCTRRRTHTRTRICWCTRTRTRIRWRRYAGAVTRFTETLAISIPCVSRKCKRTAQSRWNGIEGGQEPQGGWQQQTGQEKQRS